MPEFSDNQLISVRNLNEDMENEDRARKAMQLLEGLDTNTLVPASKKKSEMVRII